MCSARGKVQVLTTIPVDINAQLQFSKVVFLMTHIVNDLWWYCAARVLGSNLGSHLSLANLLCTQTQRQLEHCEALNSEPKTTLSLKVRVVLTKKNKQHALGWEIAGEVWSNEWRNIKKVSFTTGGLKSFNTILNTCSSLNFCSWVCVS